MQWYKHFLRIIKANNLESYQIKLESTFNNSKKYFFFLTVHKINEMCDCNDQPGPFKG